MSYSINSKNYFLDYIETEKKRIEKFQKLKDKCENDQQLEKCNLVLMNFYKNIICCMCTINQRDDEFYSMVKSYLSLTELVDKNISESEKIDSIAIKYLFIDNSEKQYDKFLKKLNQLSDFKVYSSFVDILSQENIYSNLKSYMGNNWYKECDDYPWHDSHLSNNNTFVGYISFVASAIAKRYKINISDIRYVIK